MSQSTELARARDLLGGFGYESSSSFRTIKIGSYHYPSSVPVRLRWSGAYGEFTRDPEWYFTEHGDEMRKILLGWGLESDEASIELSEYVEYGGTHWEDTRTGIQGKIEQSWSSLAELVDDHGLAAIALAGQMELVLPAGTLHVDIDKWSLCFPDLPRTSLGNVGKAGVKWLQAKVDAGQALSLVEEFISSQTLTSSAQKSWSSYVTSCKEQAARAAIAAESKRQQAEAAAEAQRQQAEAAAEAERKESA